MPKRTFNEVVTVWNRYTDTATGQQTDIRTLLPACHWQENSISIFNRTGASQANNINFTVMKEREGEYPKQLRLAEWAALSREEAESGKYYMISPSQTLYYLGNHPYIFAWGTSAQVTTAESQFKTANQPAGQATLIKTGRDCNYAWYGKRSMWHINARAGN